MPVVLLFSTAFTQPQSKYKMQTPSQLQKVEATTVKYTTGVTQTLVSSSLTPSQILVVNPSNLSNQSSHFMQKLAKSGLLREFGLHNGQLTLKDPLAKIITLYHLLNSDVNIIQSMLLFSQQHRSAISILSNKMSDTAISPELNVNGTVLYFTDSDLYAFLISAATIGPEALDAAFTAIATLFGGPVGTVIGIVLGILGGSGLSYLVYLVLQAGWLGEGIYIGVKWTPFPNFTSGLWCGCN